MAIQIGAWLLRNVLEQVQGTKPGATPPHITLDPAAWVRTAKDGASTQGTGAAGVLLWEAFVSGPGHARAPNAHGVSEHIQDAATAAVAFRAWCSILPRSPTAVSCDSPIATLGAIALWAGWTKDITLLSQQPLVLWPDHPLGANVVLDDEASATNAAENPSHTSDHIGDDAVFSAASLSVICGDSHSIWRHHQDGSHMADFQLLVSRFGTSSSLERECNVTFDGGVTWQSLVLRMVTENQICWKGYNARASKASKIVALVRT
jgi:hypothetical protein